MKTRFALDKEKATHRYPTDILFGDGYFDDGFKYLEADSVIAALDFPSAQSARINMQHIQVNLNSVWGFIEDHKEMLKGDMSIYIKQHRYKNGDRLVLHINNEYHPGYKAKVNLELFYGALQYDGTFTYLGSEFFYLGNMFDAVRCFDIRKKRINIEDSIGLGTPLDQFFEEEKVEARTDGYKPNSLGAILADAIKQRKQQTRG